VLRALLAEDLRLRALALTTITLFALVPALVVAFSFLQAFAGMEEIWRRAQDFLIANLAVGARATLVPHLEKFVHNAHAAGAGAVGALFLVVSAVALLHQVEKALNDLWAVRRQRPLLQRALIYWAALTLGPVLLAASLTIAHQVQLHLGAGAARAMARSVSLALTSLFFTVLYLIVPATRVRRSAALLGGLLAGITWELAKGLYTFAVARFIDYSAIYGSLAAVPIFLIWLQISWTIVLFGARVAFVAQHARQLVRAHAPEATPLGRELLAARALLAVARAFHSGAKPPEPDAVAAALDVLVEPVRDVLAQLRGGGLILEAAGGGLLPARPLEQISLADVRHVLSGGTPRAGEEPEEALVAAVLAGADDAAARSLSGLSFAEMCRRLEGDRPAAP
jgi:membrane protein